MNVKILGSWQENYPGADVGLIIADPVYGTSEIPSVCNMVKRLKIPGVVFMWPKDLLFLIEKPDQIMHWIKPVSTKNTSKKYSNFVEVIAGFNLKMNDCLHWSNRTGIFTDALLSNDEHEWKKPESLIERLIRNHYQGGVVYDPCAGSFTVHNVCKRLGIPSVSVEINKKYHLDSTLPSK